MEIKRYLIVGPNCGRLKDGTFHCECGRCRELDPEETVGDYDILSSPRKYRMDRITGIGCPLLIGFFGTLLLVWAMERVGQL